MDRFYIWILLIISVISQSCNNEKVQEYYDDGTPKYEGHKVAGKKEGTWIYYNPEGDTAYVEYYLNDSIFKKDTYTENWLSTVEFYKNGMRNGKVTTFHQNGAIRCESTAVNGALVGKSTCFHENGQLYNITYFNQNRPEGEFVQYWPNGKRSVYSSNVGNGIHEFYDSMGHLLRKVLFENFQPTDTITLDLNS